MSALGRVVRAGVGRRRVQTLVMTLTTLTAVTASVLGAGLLVVSQAPFDHAFNQQNGAHLAVVFDASKATGSQLTATEHAAGVTAAAGPFPVLSLAAQAGKNSSDTPVGSPMPPLTVAGRGDPNGPVDDLVLTAGHWAGRTGEIVLNSKNPQLSVGDHLVLPDSPGKPSLLVVGLARSVSSTADAWVTPAELTALSSSSATPQVQMLYRFASTGNDAAVAADRSAIAAAVPAGAITQAASYLPVKTAADRNSAPYVPFVVAFAILGLVMSILVIAIVVGGAVGAATRRIGILKAIGFTPSQVVRAYVAQALIPALVGTVLGVLAGNAASVVILGKAGKAYGTDASTVPAWVDLTVALVVLAAVVASALAPALRAGRLRTIDALVVGRTPATGRGRVIGERLGRLPLPRHLSLGLASPFRRPARSATMAAAVMLGAVGVTFGVGLAVSLNGVQNAMDMQSSGDVVVQDLGGAGGGPAIAPSAPAAGSVPAPPTAPLAAKYSPAKYSTVFASSVTHTSTGFDTTDTAKVAAAITAQSGTAWYYSSAQTSLGVAGLAGQTKVVLYTGDSTHGAYQMISGSWFTGPGQAVVPSGFLNSTGTHVGDTITLTDNGKRADVRIVGEVFDLQNGGLVVLTDAASVAGLNAYVLPPSMQYNIGVKPGVSVDSYLGGLNSVLTGTHFSALPNKVRVVSNTVLAMDTLTALLTLMLVAVAGLGVLNTVVLDTRERVHDLGVFKALGMSPRQTLGMVVTSVAAVGLLAGLVGVPIGVLLHGLVLPAMGHAAGTEIPAADLDVFTIPLLGALLLGGIAIAVIGALPPASWAAKARTVDALRAE